MLSVWVLIILAITALVLISVFIGLALTVLAQYRRHGRTSKPDTKKSDELPVLRWPSFRTGFVEGYTRSPIAEAQCVAIQPRTYDDLQKSEDNLTGSSSSSVAAEGLDEKRAKLKFTLQYNIVESTLTVKLLQAKNLTSLREKPASDVTYYVALKILPISHRSFQSHTVKGERNPTFDDSFEFSVPHNELSQQNLKFTACCFDRFSHHDSIGELRVNLCELETRGLSLSREVLLYRELNEVPKIVQTVGEVMVSLGYLRLTERLAVVLIAGRDLPLLETGYRPDPYAQVTIYHEGHSLRQKKTYTQTQECNPVFNESLTFHIPQGILHQTSILICMMHHTGRDGDDVILGQVLLGPETTGVQFEHWNDMRENNKPVARWHKLHAGCE